MNSTLLAAAVMLFASWTSIALAGNSQTLGNSGTTHFTGAIAESLCDADVQQKRLDVFCSRAGKTSVRTLSLNSTSWQALPADMGSAQISWIDSQHKIGMLTVNYH